MSCSRCFGSRTRHRRSRSRTGRGSLRRQPGPVGLARQHRRKDVAHGLAGEQPRAGEHLPQHDAESPDVGSLVDGRAACLLGRHVGGSAEDHPGGGALCGAASAIARRLTRRAAVAGPGLGEAEVEHFHRAVVADLDVGGLQIAMDDPFVVRGLERLGDLPRDRQRLVERESGRARAAAARSSPSTSSIARKCSGASPVGAPRIRRRARCGVIERGEQPALRARSARVVRRRAPLLPAAP